MGFSEKTKNNIRTASGNKCAFENCDVIFVKDGTANIVEVAHIYGEKKGSARYDPKMTCDERNHFDNAIALCPTHHTKIDKNESLYSGIFLQTLKKNHERKVCEKLNQKHPNFLGKLLLVIVESDWKNCEELKIVNSFTIEDKIKFNNVRRYKYIFDEFKVYQTKLQTLYNELEDKKTYQQEIFLNNIRLLYLQAKGELLPENSTKQDIEKKSDDLIDRVLELLEEKIQNKKLSMEEIFFGLRIIVVDAFMRCKILEEPK